MGMQRQLRLLFWLVLLVWVVTGFTAQAEGEPTEEPSMV